VRFTLRRVRAPRPVAGCLLVGLLVSGLAGCADAVPQVEPSQPVAAAPSGSETASPETTAPPPPAASPTDDGPLTLAFGGDVHFATKLAPLLDAPGTALDGLEPYLAAADVAMVNLETAITTRGSEMPKQFHFRAPATSLTALDAAGVDVVTMANNHAVDYGEVGLRDTLAARERSPIPVVGLGEDAADAYAAAVLDVRGTRVAVLGATQVPDWTLATWPASSARPGVAEAASPARLATAVRAARTKADVVVVYLHWGTDYTTCPNALQKRTARALADAGADVVVGTHAHRVQGAGWLGSTYVAYGLGNFVWWRRNSVADATSGVLTLDVEGRRVAAARWVPMLVGADGIPREPDAATSRRMQRDWVDARACTGLSSRPSSS